MKKEILRKLDKQRKYENAKDREGRLAYQRLRN